MPKHTSITLGDYFNDFIAREIATGRFGTASEVVRAGLRLLELEENKLEALRTAIDEGDASPESEDMDGEEAFARLRANFGLDSPRG